MKKRVSSVKFKGGYDANKMLMRKLLVNFFTNGKIVTTEAKAKALKRDVERLVEKTKEKTEANKNFLMRYITSEKVMDHLYTNVGTALKDKTGGYVRIERLHQRLNDGAQMARLVWAHPVVNETKAEAPAMEVQKPAAKQEKKTEAAKPLEG